MATITNLVVDQGTTFTTTITLTTDDGSEKDLTDYTVTSNFEKVIILILIQTSRLQK